MADVTLEQVRGTYKTRDSWWTVLLVDPLAGRLVRRLVAHSWLTPTRLTVLAFLLGLAAAAALFTAAPAWLVAGAVLYYMSFLVDCVDGKLARLRDERSVVGSWLDFVLDRVRVVVATVALFGGQFLLTGEAVFLVAAVVVVFLSLFGYLNGAEIDKASAQMAAAAPIATEPRAAPAPDDTSRLPGPLARLSAALHRRRIRLNLVSGVEFEMALFVIAPLLAAALGGAAVLVVAVVAGVLLVLFEVALVLRFLLTARAADRQRPRSQVPPQRVLTDETRVS